MSNFYFVVASSAPNIKKNKEEIKAKVVTQTHPSIQDCESVRYEAIGLDSKPAESRGHNNYETIGQGALSKEQEENYHRLGPEYYKPIDSIDDGDGNYHLLGSEYASGYGGNVYEDPTVKRYHTVLQIKYRMSH